MNTPNSPIADVQNTVDTRHIAINKVGIKSIRHPIKVQDKSTGVQHTIAMFNMYVGLPHNFKGTHMSRFVEILNSHEREISVENFPVMLRDMVAKLEAETGHIEMNFPYFINKTAPISGVQSLMDYDVTFIGDICHGEIATSVKVVVPVTSLCPCSKKISEYGAHNQRCRIEAKVRMKSRIWIEEIVRYLEKAASTEVFAVLKRPDEKYVTEAAYDNPKFVEDIVRDLALLLDGDDRISWFTINSENFESIHNHNAFAELTRDKR